MSELSMLDTQPVKAKRKRIVYSCENCRSKKLKCDRARPVCSTCLKQNNNCEYFNARKVVSDPTVGTQLEVLKERLYELEQKRRGLVKGNALDEVDFSYVLSFPALISKNKYLNTIRLDTGRVIDSDKVPMLIEEQFIKEKRQVSDVEILKHKMKMNNSTTTNLIKNYLNDKNVVWELINHFFNSELYLSYSFIDRNYFYLKVTEFLQKIDTEEKIAKPDLVLVASIVIVLRIAFASYYNCGYEHYQPSKIIGPEALTLAIVCLDEALIAFDAPDTDLCNLMLLIYYCQRFSPEALGPIIYNEKISTFSLFRKFLESNLNFDPDPTDPDAEFRRRRWHQFLEVERLEFVYSGLPIQINDQNYTTLLPTVYHLQTEDDAINECYQERYKIQNYLVEFSKMINNVRTSSTLGAYEQFLKKINDFNVSLNEILSLDSSSKYSRWVKTIKFMNYLDISSIEYMLSMHMYLHYDDKIGDEEALKRVLEYLSRNTNQIITLSYFFDSQQQHFYNLKQHFGFTIEIIPRIVQSLHRGVQYQMTILTKLSIQSIKGSNYPVIDEIRKVLFQNTKVIVSSLGRVSNEYSYAKRLYMILSFIVLKLFGHEFELNPKFAEKIFQQGNFVSFTEPILNTILKDLTALTGDRQLVSDNTSNGAPYQEPLTSFFSEMFHNRTDAMMQIDTSMIEQLEAFLNTQSFLSA